MAFCKYRTPPWINLVLRLLVPQEKSSLSTKAVERPVKTTILCFLSFFLFFKMQTKIGCIIHYTQVHSIPQSPSSILRSYTIYCIQMLKYSCYWRQSCSSFFRCWWRQCWCSGESTCLPPIWPGFDFRTRHHMWMEFVGSLLRSERFSPGLFQFSPLIKNQHLTWFDLLNNNYYCKIVIWTVLISCRIILL